MAHGRRKGKHKEEESGERWLLTYADMITLLMALFMVLFSISSVNISKYRTLQKSLRAAFSGNILPGGKSIMEPGASSSSNKAPTSIDVQAIVPVQSLTASTLQSTSTHGAANGATSAAEAASQSAQEQAALFQHIKEQIEHYAQTHGFSRQVKAVVEQRGLDVKVLTDDLLFASGSAALDPAASPLLTEIAHLLNLNATHPIDVEGNTDDVPISGTYPSNWELSAARASTVVRFLIAQGVSGSRLTATGNAEQRPSATNSTAAGRAQNRKVEIVLKALNPGETAP